MLPQDDDQVLDAIVALMLTKYERVYKYTTDIYTPLPSQPQLPFALVRHQYGNDEPVNFEHCWVWDWVADVYVYVSYGEHPSPHKLDVVAYDLAQTARDDTLNLWLSNMRLTDNAEIESQGMSFFSVYTGPMQYNQQPAFGVNYMLPIRQSITM